MAITPPATASATFSGLELTRPPTSSDCNPTPPSRNKHLPLPRLLKAILTIFALLGGTMFASPVPAAHAPSPQPPATPADQERESFARAGVTSLWLENGLRVHLRPMPRCGRVVFVASIAGGAVLETAEQRGLTRAAAAAWARPAGQDRVIEFSGPNGPSGRMGPDDAPRDIADEPPADPAAKPDPRGAAVRLSRSAWPEGIMLRLSTQSSAPDDLITIIATARQMIATPTADPDRLTAWTGQERTRRAPSGPGLVIDAFMEGVAAEGRAVFGRLTPAQLDRLTLDRAQDWLGQHLTESPIEVALVGDFVLDAAIAAVAPLGTLPGRARIGPATFAQQRILSRPPGPRRIEKTVESGGKSSHIFIACPAPAISDLSTVRHMNVAARIVRTRAEAALTERGFTSTRVMAQAMPGRLFLDGGLFVVSARVAGDTDDLARAQAAIFSALDTLATVPPEVDEVRRRSTDLAEEAARRQGDPDYWASVLPICTFHGLSPDALADAAKAYSSIAPSDITLTMVRWTNEKDRVEFIARPAPKALADPAPSPSAPPLPSPR